MPLIKNNQNVHLATEFASFSSMGMFSHLFDVHPQVSTNLTKGESIIQKILYEQFCVDPTLKSNEPYDRKSTILILELEQVLTKIFTPESRFWESYYGRRGSIRNDNHSVEKRSTNSPESDIYAIPSTFPNFFTLIDALYYASGERSSDFAIIHNSLRHLITGFVFALRGCEGKSQESIAQALKMLGPVSAPKYRQYLLGFLN